MNSVFTVVSTAVGTLTAVSTAVGTLTAKGETVIGSEPPRISGYLKHAE